MPDASPRDLLLISLNDPAIDRTPPIPAAQSDAIDRYGERRTVDALAAVRMLVAPAAFRVRALSPLARTRCLSMGGAPCAGDRYSPQQLLGAVRMGIVSVIREANLTGNDGIPTGPEDVLPTLPESDPPILTDAALDGLQAAYGGATLDELGTVILDRAAMHPRRLTTFTLPRSVRDQT